MTSRKTKRPTSGFSWLLDLLRQYAAGIVLVVVLVMVVSAANLVLPWYLGSSIGDLTVGSIDSRSLTAHLWTLLGIGVTSFLVNLAQGLVLAVVGEKIVLSLRSIVHAHIHSFSMGTMQNFRGVDLISRLTNDVSQIRTLFVNCLPTLCVQSLTVVGSILLMSAVSPLLTVVIVGVLLLGFLIAVPSAALVQSSARKLQSQIGHSAVLTSETVGAIQIVKSFCTEQIENRLYVSTAKQIYMSAIRLGGVGAFLGAINTFLAIVGLLCLVIVGIHEIEAHNLTASQLATFVAYSIVASAGCAGLASSYTLLRQSEGSLGRIRELLLTETENEQSGNFVSADSVGGKIEFVCVSFGYDQRCPVLKNLDLSFEAGKRTAIVGPSGAGKSTIVNLVLRFWDPDGGHILLDDVDISQYSRQSLRSMIGVVHQDAPIFGRTIADNIRYGRPDASDAEVERAARQAEAHDFIVSLPEGYYTKLSDRGGGLSGGQRQRISIARAFLKDPKILILDEATSSLDARTEREVSDSLERLMVGRTTIVIGHTEGALRGVDKVISLDFGTTRSGDRELCHGHE